MGNNSNPQKNVLLLTSLISLAIHTSIILFFSGANKGEKVSPSQKIIKIELVKIKSKQQLIVPEIKPKEQLPTKKKTPQPIPQIKPSVNKQTESHKPKGEPASRERSPKINPSIDTGSQTSKETAVAATSNTSGSASVSKSTSPKSSIERTSIIQKQTPRCRQCREPLVPRRAEKRGEEGYASLRLYVSASGKVVKTTLLNSSGHSGWNNAARKAAMSSTFYPMALQNTIDIMYELKMK